MAASVSIHFGVDEHEPTNTAHVPVISGEVNRNPGASHIDIGLRMWINDRVRTDAYSLSVPMAVELVRALGYALDTTNNHP